MSKRMLIDASHPEETRVVVFDSNRVEEFDFEAASKRPLKGNIYLAKVTRVEPSLQAAFVEYGGNRQGFLAFSEIHPDYYQIPVADRQAILQAQTQRMMAEEEFDSVDTARDSSRPRMLEAENGDDENDREETSEEESASSQDDSSAALRDGGGENSASTENSSAASESASEEDSNEAPAQEDADSLNHESQDLAAQTSGETANSETGADDSGLVQVESTSTPAVQPRRGSRQNDRPRPPRRRQYKIQEVIKRRQIMLIQVVKEERGNKGASLTTFLSLAGRYCVLMPNTPRGGGISRKITNAADRKRLKSAAQSLELPEGMGLIIRTAGANRTKLEIKRDYEYLLRLWDTVRELTLKSNAPALVYEEGSLIKRAIRDLYSKDISEIIVDGEAGYRDAKDFMRMLMPSHAKNVKPYKDALPLFQSHHVEAQLDAMFSPVVNLRSGGYIVINQTEALVAIDVNSGKATREHSIEETAHKTNLEAADEIGRQLRLRDLAGLIVIDFIDMEDAKNDRNVEKRLHNAVRGDRARIQVGKISQFGLMEMSRQRLRAGVLAGSTVTCPHCAGQGIIRSTESAALKLLRALDEEGERLPSANLMVKAPVDVTIYTLNQKRREIARIEEAYDLGITFEPQATMVGGSFEIERTGVRIPTQRVKPATVSVEAVFQEVEPVEPETDITIVEAPVESASAVAPVSESTDRQAGGQDRGRKRKRRRRGGRGRGPNPALQESGSEGHNGSGAFAEPGDAHADANSVPLAAAEDGGSDRGGDEGEAEHAAESGPSQTGEAGGKRRRRRRGRRGRHRDGNEITAQNHADESQEVAQTFPDMNAGSGYAADAALPVESEATPATGVPNGSSSPQWSLTDLRTQAEEREIPAPPPSPAPLVPAQAELRAMVEEMQSLSRREEEPAQSSVFEEASSQAPQDARKGWWQRRFKI